MSTPTTPSPTPSRYRWTFMGITFDFYRLCEILGIISHAQAHALKKVIRAGRGDKSLVQDIDEAIDAMRRWREMVIEDRAKSKPSVADMVEGMTVKDDASACTCGGGGCGECDTCRAIKISARSQGLRPAGYITRMDGTRKTLMARCDDPVFMSNGKPLTTYTNPTP